MAKRLIEIKNVVKTFGQQVVLKGINLDCYFIRTFRVWKDDFITHYCRFFRAGWRIGFDEW